MRLSELIRASGRPLSLRPVETGGQQGTDDPDILALHADSRSVVPGSLFAALPGTQADGRAFIAQAIDRGAVAVLVPGDTPETRLPGPVRVPVLRAPRPRGDLACLAAAFEGRQPATVAAVTGTNGKTSTVQFVRQIWARLGHRSAAMGTLGLIQSAEPPADVTAPSALTTPDPVALHRCLAGLAVGGVDHVAMEASSHGLDQERLDGIRFAAGAFLNLSQDHLDYHRTLDAYFQAKARLLRELLPAGAPVVVNGDMAEMTRLSEIARKRDLDLWDFGYRARRLRLIEVRPEREGAHVRLAVEGAEHTVFLPLAGTFQALNALAALGIVIALGGDRDAAIAALSTLEPPPGRMELVARHPGGAPIFVDYAHSPGGLETALTSLRAHTPGRLIVVFGCGGDRDRGKRPVMGEIARRNADHVIVTDDNPRSEDPATIRADILAGVSAAEEIGDRASAIRSAIAQLGPRDALLIAGKGHERGQIVGESVLPFADDDQVRAAVAALDPADGPSIEGGSA